MGTLSVNQKVKIMRDQMYEYIAKKEFKDAEKIADCV